MDGSIESVVWPSVLEKTPGLWKPGVVLSLTGTVRERDGRVSVAIEEAKEFDHSGAASDLPAALPGVPAQAPRPARPQSQVAEEPAPWDSDDAETATRVAEATNESRKPVPHELNSDKGSMDHYKNGNGTAGEESTHRGAGGIQTSNGVSPREGETVVIKVEETGRPAEDRYRLEDIVRLLLEYRGHSLVTLEVRTSGRVVRLDMPFATVDACPDLERRLSDLLGPDNVSMPLAAG
jgi:hypothetical protein